MELPSELTASILLRIGAFDILQNARKVCKTWRRICSDPSMWRVVDLRHSGHMYPLQMQNVIRKAVDLSCGQLVELRIELEWSHDNLLPYIADR